MGFRRRSIVLKPSGYDSDARAYFNQLTGTIPDSFKQAVNTFILTLKSDGNFTLIDRLYLHAAPNQQNATISIINPASTPITEVNAPTFTPNQGYTGNGGTMYLNHNIAENALTNYTQNSNSFFLYCRTNLTEVANEYGVYDAGPPGKITSCILNSPANFYMANNAFVTDISYGVNVNSLGFFQVRRVAGTVRTYKNAVELANNVIPASSLQALNIYSLCRNGSGIAEVFSTKQHALIGYGSGSINQSTFYAAVQTLATTLGFNV